MTITDVMTIIWESEASDYLRKCRDNKLRQDIEDTIANLAFEPRPSGIKALKCAALKWHEGCTYRIRIGKHRIIYAVVDCKMQIHIIRVGDRDDVYEVR